MSKGYKEKRNKSNDESNNVSSELSKKEIYDLKQKEKKEAKEKEKAKKYFENVDKYLASSLEKDEELKKDYNIVKELINSNIYFN